MEPSTVNFGQLAATSKHFARGLLNIGENRLELLMVELQEERMLLLRAILLALGAAVLGLLSGAALTGVVVVLFWDTSRVAVLLVLTCLYAAASAVLYRRLMLLLRHWQNLPSSVDQLRKDRACLEKVLS